ncbi:hypothetical protein CEXT_809091 [Caerostris extrusa]|uniref:Uncharacterized protein n=1 Tax=Caerostris extrusa TaxID=172846 RepID=A0AAV4TWL5_CAEEX|nr:hypothetical protein CEXT_809091 [Caerostris extrusa]
MMKLTSYFNQYVQKHLNLVFLERSMDRDKLIIWLSRSPDLHPFYIKSLEYEIRAIPDENFVELLSIEYGFVTILDVSTCRSLWLRYYIAADSRFDQLL